MKRRKFLFCGLAFSVFAVALTSCFGGSVDMSQFVDASRIHELNNEHYDYSRTTTDVYGDMVGDYLNCGNDRYKSIFTNKSITAKRFVKGHDREFDYYYDNSNQREIIYYDAFGDSFKLEENNFSIAHKTTLFVGGTSDFYKQINPAANKKEDKTIHILTLSYLDFNGYFGSAKVIVTEKGDNYFKAANVLDAEDIYETKYDEISQISRLTKINDRVYEYESNDTINRVVYDKESERNDVKITRIDQQVDEEFTTLLEIKFGNGANVFKYEIKEVNGITNDFHYVDSNKRYFVRHNASPSKIDFVPISYIQLKDHSKALILCKKILDDGELSNKWYTVQIDQDLKLSSLSEDVSIFNKEDIEYVLDGEIRVLEEKTILEVLDGQLAILYDFDDECSIILNQGYHDSYYGKLIDKISYDDKYYFKSDKNENEYLILDYVKNKKTILRLDVEDIKIVPELGIYLKPNRDDFGNPINGYNLFMYDEKILSNIINQEDVKYEKHFCTLFGEENTVHSLSDTGKNCVSLIQFTK